MSFDNSTNRIHNGLTSKQKPEFHFGKEDEIGHVCTFEIEDRVNNGRVKVVTNLDFKIRGAGR